MTDFRSDRMPSNEGRGRARAAWDGYVRWAHKNVGPVTNPMIRPFATWYATNKITDLVGFWVLWHAYGGHEGLIELGMAPTTIYRKTKGFRTVFGAHPDEYDFPGLERPDLKKWHAPRKQSPN